MIAGLDAYRIFLISQRRSSWVGVVIGDVDRPDEAVWIDDHRGRDAHDPVVGESWVPKAGLSGEEFATYVRQVAAECDRLEYLLTGRDTE